MTTNKDYTEHTCYFNTAGYCPTCGTRVAIPQPSTTAPEPVLILTPFTLPVPPVVVIDFLPEPPKAGKDPIEVVREYHMGEKGRDKINGGSPVGPGFVVFERAAGEYGYDVKMAKASIGPGWQHLVQALFDHVEHDKKWNPKSGFAHLVVTQVKEKFGDLRIYFHTKGAGQGGYDRVEGFVDALCAISRRTCEACGARGRTRNDRGWILTLCDVCDGKDRNELRTLFETEQTAC